MDAKIALAKRDRRRFPLAAEAERAAEVFNRVVRRKEVPDGYPGGRRCPKASRKDGAIRVDKLLAKIGLADSVSDAVRKIKAGAVEINGEKVRGPGAAGSAGGAGDPGGQELAAESGFDPVRKLYFWKLKRARNQARRAHRC